MDLQTALTRAGAGAEQQRLLSRLLEGSSDGVFVGGLTAFVQKVIAVDKNRAGAIVKALQDDKYVSSDNPRGSRPKWALDLTKFQVAEAPTEEQPEEPSLSEQLGAEVVALQRTALGVEDAAEVAALLDNDPGRILRMIEAMKRYLPS